MIYPPAEQRPGPPWKVWGATNVGEGVICHSAEGYEGGLWSVLDGNVSASWHFSVMRDGRVFQHYPLTASCWHAGSRGQNQRLIGIEHEGVAGEPLTEEQVGASVALVRWIAGVKGWAMQRGITLFEHNEFYPTACPSGRIPWERFVANTQMPQGDAQMHKADADPNHEDNFDTGLARLRYEAILREVVQGHREAEGDPQVLIEIIQGKR